MYSLAGVPCTPHLCHRGQTSAYTTITGVFYASVLLPILQSVSCLSSPCAPYAVGMLASGIPRAVATRWRLVRAVGASRGAVARVGAPALPACLSPLCPRLQPPGHPQDLSPADLQGHPTRPPPSPHSLRYAGHAFHGDPPRCTCTLALSLPTVRGMLYQCSRQIAGLPRMLPYRSLHPFQG